MVAYMILWQDEDKTMTQQSTELPEQQFLLTAHCLQGRCTERMPVSREISIWKLQGLLSTMAMSAVTRLPTWSPLAVAMEGTPVKQKM